MYRADVRIVEPQVESSTNPQISEYEKNQLLMKYGFSNTQRPTNNFEPTRDMSYQELMELEDRKRLESLTPRIPRVETFSIDPNSVRHHDHKFSSEDGLSLEIRIVSDMKIRY